MGLVTVNGGEDKKVSGLVFLSGGPLLWQQPTNICRTCNVIYCWLPAGYPDHMVFSEFRRRFDVLAPHLTKKHGRNYIVKDERRVSQSARWRWRRVKCTAAPVAKSCEDWCCAQTTSLHLPLICQQPVDREMDIHQSYSNDLINLTSPPSCSWKSERLEMWLRMRFNAVTARKRGIMQLWAYAICTMRSSAWLFLYLGSFLFSAFLLNSLFIGFNYEWGCSAAQALVEVQKAANFIQENQRRESVCERETEWS